MAKKAKVKVVNRDAAKAHIWAAAFANNAGEISAAAADFFDADLWASFDPVQKGLVFNGLTQKLNDSHAGAETPMEAYQWTKETLEHLRDGKWSVRVAGEGGPKGSAFYKAIAEFRGITEEAAKERIAGLVETTMEENDDMTDRKAYAAVKASILKKYPKVQEILNRMAQERIEKQDTVAVDL